MESKRKQIDRLQDVAYVKQNHDEQIADEKEDRHCETRGFNVKAAR